MRLFDVLGPVMIGPSSSHTAGAAKIGYTAQKLLGEVPAQADIGLYGSFATTGKGHGTDRALVAGLLGLRLAGDAWYHGVRHEKPFIGDERRAIEHADIPRACRLMYGTALLALLCSAALRALLALLAGRL